MDSDDRTFRNALKSISDRMKTRHTSFDKNLGTDEVFPIAVVLPIIDELLRKNSDDRYAWNRLKKDFNGPLKHRLSSEFKKLLGSVSTHPAAASGSHYDHIFFSIHFSSLEQGKFSKVVSNYLRVFLYFYGLFEQSEKTNKKYGIFFLDTRDSNGPRNSEHCHFPE